MVVSIYLTGDLKDSFEALLAVFDLIEDIVYLLNRVLFEGVLAPLQERHGQLFNVLQDDRLKIVEVVVAQAPGTHLGLGTHHHLDALVSSSRSGHARSHETDLRPRRSSKLIISHL